MKTKTTIRATLAAPNAKKPAEQPSAPMDGAGSLVVTVGGELVEAITVRTYYNPRGSGLQPVRACVWIKPAPGFSESGGFLTGRGSAGGCGYHKESAAIAEAVAHAGVKLWGKCYQYGGEPVDFKKEIHFGGTGSSAYEEIFKAIARAVGHKGRMRWISHGF